MKKNSILLLFSVALMFVLVSCSGDDVADKNDPAPSAKVQSPNRPAATQAKPAMTLAAASAVDVDGNRRTMSEWLGQKPVVVNFWGTWCPPCRREIPGLVQLYDEYKARGVEMVSLAIERSAGPAQVKAYSEQAGMKWVMLMANEEIAEAFRAGQSVPTTIFYDRSGKEVSRHVGARSYDDFKVEFEKIAGS